MKNPISWYDDILVIDRAKWRCGNYGPFAHGKQITCLLDANGYQCCLGFAAIQLGCLPDEIRGYGMPWMYKLRNTYLKDIGDKYTKFVYDYYGHERTAVIINDDQNTTRSCKELELFMLGKRNRIFVKFVGEYTDSKG